MNRWPSIVLISLLLLPGLAQAWWNGDWAYRKKITFNTTAAGLELKGDAVAAPLLIRLHTGNFSFLDAKEDAADIRVVASDDKTPLKFHVEQWDAINQLGLLWIQMPKLTANVAAEYVWIYYGNEKAPPASDSKTSYDPATLAVLHFGDKANAAKDDGPFGFAPTAAAVTSGAAGIIGYGVGFAGAGKLVLPAAPALKLPAAVGATVSLWAKPAAAGNATLFDMVDGPKSLTLGFEGDKPYVQANGGTPVKVVASAAAAPGAWHHLAATLKDKLVLYVDGAEAGSAPAASFDLGGSVTVGDSAAGGAPFKGEIDEIELSATARSADFVKLAAGSQAAAETKLYALGQDEQGTSQGSSYFAILLHSVTLDGWVVIGILCVMAVISFWVMGSKAVFLARTHQGNLVFQQEFAKLSTDLLGLHTNAERLAALARVKGKRDKADSTGALLQSSLYRIYDLGVRELLTRFEKCERNGQPRSLTPQALGAIKASLDAGYVRETHRLNSLLVLLTIAISGGPFLGLLGTVVGVMITFAAIAAAGDVNVNAIAPGIAAALVATVAGLGVAIPSLFGYNYLSSRIKNMTADMQVFTDEFITKLAEQYS
jgi:biopolymer transport protein ExbB